MANPRITLCPHPTSLNTMIGPNARTLENVTQPYTWKRGVDLNSNSSLQPDWDKSKLGKAKERKNRA